MDPVRTLEAGLDEIELLLEMAEEGGDLEEVRGDIDTTFEGLTETFEKLEFRLMLGGPSDNLGAYV